MNRYEVLPVLTECDVLVVGGGPAGCAAAVTSARAGAKTLLVESNGGLGGATVSQNVVAVLSQNGVDFQGIWHEYMKRILDMGGAQKSEFCFEKPLIHGTIDPVIVQYVWDKLICESGAELLLHIRIVDALKQNGVIIGAVADTKAGLRRILAKRVIDCTGDGTFADKAGCRWEQGANGTPYAMSLTKVIRLGGIGKDAGIETTEEFETLKANVYAAVEKGEFHSPLVTTGRVLNYIGPNKTLMWRLPEARNELVLVTSRILNADPLSPTDITRAERQGMWDMYEVAQVYQRFVKGCEKCFIADISNHVGVRSSRRVEGIYKITDHDVMSFKKCKDSVAKASWQVDVWPPDSYTKPAGNAGGITDQGVIRVYLDRIIAGEYFDVPYGSIVARDVDNLFLAGRIISATHLAEASIRIQQTCMATGEAAGLAAALSVQFGKTPKELDGVQVSEQLFEMRNKIEPAFLELR